MPFASLREFISHLEAAGDLVRVGEPVSTVLEMTEIQTRALAEGGPTILFERPTGTDGRTHETPVLVNLFGTVARVAAGIGRNGPEDRGVSERCLLGFNTGPPITPGGYNQNVQIFQVPGTVALLTEMVHDSRIIPLDGRPHVADDIRQWKGDSRGYWDGDTLVVETTNFTHKIASFSPHPFASYGSAEKMHLTERFTRVDDDTLHYEFTVNDPRTFTQPFTAILQMQKADHALYEYACHEGNYGLHNVLAGARQEEQEAAASQQAQH